MMEKQNSTNVSNNDSNNCESNNELHLFLHDYKSVSMLQQLTSLWQLVTKKLI